MTLCDIPYILLHNRWVKLAQIIPWDELADAYYSRFHHRHGRPAKDARLVIGAVIIKHKLCLSDEETIEQIRENLYYQYFVGLKMLQTKAIFAPSLFVEIRKRIHTRLFRSSRGLIVKKPEKIISPSSSVAGRERSCIAKAISNS